MEFFDTSLEVLLKRGLWSRLLAEARLAEPVHDPDERRLAKGLRRLAHVECAEQIRQWLDTLEGGRDPDRLAEMLHVSLWGAEGRGWSLDEGLRRLKQNPASEEDLRAVLKHRLRHAPAHPAGQIPTVAGPLTLHAAYTQDEILAGLGHWAGPRRPPLREGVLHLPGARVDVLLVTLQKSEDEYSPTTRYEDYLISPNLFHWQSQSNKSDSSPTCQRYIHHQRMGYIPLLFVREAN